MTGLLRGVCVACGNITALICEGVSIPCRVLDIALSAARLRAVYQGRANRILLLRPDGRRVSLPVHHVRPFLTYAGVYGALKLKLKLEFSAAGE